MRCNIYCEEQVFRKTMLMKVMLIVDIGMVLFSLYLMYEQLIMGKPIGDHPMSNGQLVVFSAILIFLAIIMFLAFHSMALLIDVREDGIYYMFKPFHRSFQKIPFEEIKEIEIVPYGPFRYGMGIHWAPGWRAFTLQGSKAIRIKRRSGPDLILSSLRPEQFADVVKSYLNQW